MRRPTGRSSHLGPVVVGLLVLLVVGVLPAGANGSGYPPLPAAEFGGFLEGLAAPTVAPGASGEVTFTLHDPLPVSLTSIVVTVTVYAFNAYPGNATGPVPAASLTLGGSGTAANVTVPDLAPGASESLGVAVAASSAAPQGTYAIRTAVAFTANGTAYLLESRGYFDGATWAAATSGPNGTTQLNVSRLGVSAVVPETAVLVRANPFPIVLAVLVGIGVVVAGAGAYFASRERAGSTSGARPVRDARSAPRAFGKRRTRDGD